MSKTNIQPSTQTTSVVIYSFSVSCRSLELFNGATFTVDTFDINGKLIARQVLVMDQPTYLEWNNNDEFVCQWVATQLGFVIEVPPEVPVESSGP